MLQHKPLNIIDNKVQCWYCGQETMKSKDTYYQCRKCGATWVEIPDYPVIPFSSGKKFPTPWDMMLP